MSQEIELTPMTSDDDIQNKNRTLELPRMVAAWEVLPEIHSLLYLVFFKAKKGSHEEREANRLLSEIIKIRFGKLEK